MQDKLENYREYLLQTIEQTKRRFEKAIVQEDEYMAHNELEYIIHYENLLKRLETYEV